MSEVDKNELHDLLLGYLDGVDPVRADDVWSRRPRPPFMRTAAAAGAAVVFACLVLVAALLAMSNGSKAPAETLQATNGGPCAGSPPGCGSALGSATALASGKWSTFPSGPLSPRSGQVEVWTGKDLIVWGGLLMQATGTVVYSDGAVYNPSKRTWRMHAALALVRSGGCERRMDRDRDGGGRGRRWKPGLLRCSCIRIQRPDGGNRCRPRRSARLPLRLPSGRGGNWS